jgi:glutamate racemase
MSAPARIGILDWGIGGVGVLRELRRRAPSLPVIYLSDSGFVPYGLLSSKALGARVATLIRYLTEAGATSLVVACNAASTVLDTIEPARVPVLGVIAPALALVPKSFRGTLGVLGGRRTIRSQLYRRGLEAPGRRIIQRVAQPLSAHIEAGTANSERCARDLDRILSPLRNADALLLACTHYPAIADQLTVRVPDARLFDPAEEVVTRLLDGSPLPALKAPDLVLTTGDACHTRKAAARAWGFDVGACSRTHVPDSQRVPD